MRYFIVDYRIYVDGGENHTGQVAVKIGDGTDCLKAWMDSVAIAYDTDERSGIFLEITIIAKIEVPYSRYLAFRASDGEKLN